MKKTKQSKYKVSCKDCNCEILGDKNMVMLKDDLWKFICDDKEDLICDMCIEERMGRKITKEDFKEPSIKGVKIIPCNRYWLERKEKEK